MSRKIIALLGLEEDAEVNEQEVIENNAVVDAITELPETDMAEADEHAADVAEMEEVQERGAETAETLERVADVVEATADEGGLDPVAAEAIRICVEHMVGQLGMPAKAAGRIVSVEGFKSKTTRVQATKVAVEGIRETAANLWDRLVKMIQSVIESVKAWWGRFTDAAKKQAHRAEQIIKAAKGKQSTGTKKIKVPEILRLNNKVLAPADILSALTEIKKEFNNKDLANTEAQNKKASEEVKRALKELSAGNVENVKKVVESLKEIFSGFEASESSKLVGDKVFKQSVKGYTVKFVLEDAADKKAVKSEEVDGLDAKAVIALAQEVKSQMEYILTADKAQKENESANISIMEMLKTAFKGGKALDQAGKPQAAFDELGQTLADLRASINSIVSLSSQKTVKMKQYQASIAAAALNVCAASLKGAAAATSTDLVVQ